MALGKKIGEFSFTSTGVTLSENANGGWVSAVNYEGTASDYGTVIGTLTLNIPAVGAKSGTSQWRGQGFLPSGEVVVGTAQGVWHEAGKHQWRVRGINAVSNGAVFANDGVIDLASRTYKGTLLAWD